MCHITCNRIVLLRCRFQYRWRRFWLIYDILAHFEMPFSSFIVESTHAIRALLQIIMTRHWGRLRRWGHISNVSSFLFDYFHLPHVFHRLNEFFVLLSPIRWLPCLFVSSIVPLNLLVFEFELLLLFNSLLRRAWFADWFMLWNTIGSEFTSTFPARNETLISIWIRVLHFHLIILLHFRHWL